MILVFGHEPRLNHARARWHVLVHKSRLIRTRMLRQANRREKGLTSSIKQFYVARHRYLSVGPGVGGARSQNLSRGLSIEGTEAKIRGARDRNSQLHGDLREGCDGPKAKRTGSAGPNPRALFGGLRTNFPFEGIDLALASPSLRRLQQRVREPHTKGPHSRLR